MDDPFSGWKTASALTASAKHVHALGVITLLYNDLEYGMLSLFDEQLRADPEICEAIFVRLSNRERVDILRDLALKQESDPAVRDAVLYGVKCFDLCAENRNTLMHIIHSWSEWNKENDLYGKKRSSDKSHDVWYLVTADELRKVADDMLATHQFVRLISMFLMRRRYEEKGPTQNALVLAMPDTLPNRPAQPSKLNPLPPRQERENG